MIDSQRTVIFTSAHKPLAQAAIFPGQLGEKDAVELDQALALVQVVEADAEREPGNGRRNHA